MPITRSHASHSTLLPTSTQDGGIRKASKRVNPSPEQLLLLDAFHQLSRLRPLAKQDYARMTADTGLSESWIKRWLSRKNHPRRPSAASSPSAGTTTSDTVSGQRDTPADPSAIQSNQKSLNTSNLSMLDLLSDGLPHSISAIRPEVSRSLSDSVLQTSLACNSLGNEPVFHYGRSYTLLATSPSLGYIPSVFPTSLPPSAKESPSLSSSSSSDSSAPSDIDSIAMQYLTVHNTLPTIPDLHLSTRMEDSNCTNTGTLSMYQLLQEAIETPKITEHADVNESDLPGTSQSQFFTSSLVGGYRHNSSMLSFAPSLQSHSTSVIFGYTMPHRARPSVPQNLLFHPIPVSFKTRLSDLPSMSKRIQAMSLQDLLDTADGAHPEGSFASGDGSLGSLISNQPSYHNHAQEPMTPAESETSLLTPLLSPSDAACQDRFNDRSTTP